MSYKDIVKKQLVIDEGKRNKPYRCTAGKLTIGIGHNLDDNGISDKAIDFIFNEDLEEVEKECRKLFPNFDSLNNIRKAVVMNMMFNLGYDRFSKFRMTINSILNSGYKTAANQMRDSLWYKQVGSRAERLARQMETGVE